MAADVKAPRMARSQTNMAQAAAAIRAASTSNGAAALLDFKVNGVAPFRHSPLYAAQDLIRQISGLLEVLSAAHADAAAAEHGGVFDANSLATVTGEVSAAAFDGLHSLSALAAFFLEQHRGAQ